VAQFSIELILVKQLASGLAIPTFIANAAGTLVFINEPAERLLGIRFDELDEMPLEAWSTGFAPVDERGDPVPPGDLPLVIALTERRPAHGPLRIVGHDGVRRNLEISAFPLESAHGQLEGGVAMFWEVPEA